MHPADRNEVEIHLQARLASRRDLIMRISVPDIGNPNPANPEAAEAQARALMDHGLSVFVHTAARAGADLNYDPVQVEIAGQTWEWSPAQGFTPGLMPSRVQVSPERHLAEQLGWIPTAPETGIAVATQMQTARQAALGR